jgi:hypothetical protein
MNSVRVFKHSFAICLLFMLLSHTVVLGQNDTTPPDLSISYSPSVVTTDDQVTFTAIASDPSGISKMTILVNAILMKTCSSSPCVYLGGPYPEGSVTYGANAWDTKDNRAWTGYQGFIVEAGEAVTVVFDRRDMADTLIPIFFEGFDMKLSSGSGEGQVLLGETAHSLGFDDIYLDIPDIVIRDWYTFGIMVHLYLNSLNLENYDFRWSNDKGGCLSFSITFEEDGKEILGTWHGDISNAQLTIYFIPYIDSYKSLHWKVDVDFNFDWEIYGIPESWFIDKDDLISKLEKAVKYTLSNDVDGILLNLLSIGGVKSNKNAIYNSAGITRDLATFVYLPHDPPRLVKDIKVIFDHINVHDDEDWFASGELYFKGEVNDNSTEWSDEFSASSGSTVYLTGTQWKRNVSVVEEQPLNIEFKGYDDDVTTTESLGKVNLTHVAPTWNISTELQRKKSSRPDDFTLNYWILDAETPPGYKRLSVKFDRIDVHDDEDNNGSGELFFKGTVNNLSTGWSGQYDRDSGSKIYLGGSGKWQKTVLVRDNGILNIHFRGYDEDTFYDDSLGELTLTYSEQDDWGIGCHQQSSSNRDFTLHFRVIDEDAEPSGDTDRFLITFMRVDVHYDEDNSGSGELFFYGAVNCDYTSRSNQMDLNSGDSKDLIGGNWFKRVRIPRQAGTIQVFFTGYDEDVTTIETLGDVNIIHSSSDNWGLNGTHTQESSNGDFTLTYKVERLE